MRCRITETSPHGYLEEVSEDCLPQEHLYAVGVDCCVQILDMASLQSAVLQNAESNFEELPGKDIKQEDELMFDPQDELLFEKLLLESKKDMHGSDKFMNDKITKSLTKGAGDSLDFESESDKVRDALDFSFEEALLNMKANRTSESFVVEPVRSAFEIDPLQSKRSWQISAETPVTNIPTRQGTSQEDEVAGLLVNKGRPDEDLDLLYDPTLDCYYDPKTNRYYELK